MKLFSIKTLSTIIILSTTILLSACCDCGDSDSSGSDATKTDTPKAESNSSGSQKEKDKQNEPTKKENYSLIGYWKSECFKDVDKNQYSISYTHFKKIDDKQMQIISKGKDFTNKNCTGKSVAKYGYEQPINITDISNKMIDNNHWLDTDDNLKFTRISADEFNSVKIK